MAGAIARFWDDTVLPFAVELCCASSSIARQRQKVVPSARGHVLELGVGSGLNLGHYDPARVEALVALDPSRALLDRAAERTGAVPFEVTLLEASAEAIPVEDASVDSVVVTYALCSIPRPTAALAEVRRVLRHGGRLVFSEHGLAPDPGPAGWQRRLDPAWSRLGGGCHLSRDVRGLLAAAGFETGPIESMYLPGPRWLNYHYWGVVEAAT